jgi:hypothetical protein
VVGQIWRTFFEERWAGLAFPVEREAGRKVAVATRSREHCRDRDRESFHAPEDAMATGEQWIPFGGLEVGTFFEELRAKGFKGQRGCQRARILLEKSVQERCEL